MTKLEQITEEYPDEQFLYPTGYEDCVVGVDSENLLLVMDSDKIIEKLINEEDMTPEDAQEHFSYNISGSKGEGYPIYIRTFTEK